MRLFVRLLLAAVVALALTVPLSSHVAAQPRRAVTAIKYTSLDRDNGATRSGSIIQRIVVWILDELGVPKP